MHDTHEAPEMTYVSTSGMKKPRPLLSRSSRPARARSTGQETAAASETSAVDVQLSDAGADGGAPGGDGHGPEAELRQLRHHTKNTLQRIIGLLSEIPGLTDTPEGE